MKFHKAYSTDLKKSVTASVARDSYRDYQKVIGEPQTDNSSIEKDNSYVMRQSNFLCPNSDNDEITCQAKLTCVNIGGNNSSQPYFRTFRENKHEKDCFKKVARTHPAAHIEFESDSHFTLVPDGLYRKNENNTSDRTQDRSRSAKQKKGVVTAPIAKKAMNSYLMPLAEAMMRYHGFGEDALSEEDHRNWYEKTTVQLYNPKTKKKDTIIKVSNLFVKVAGQNVSTFVSEDEKKKLGTDNVFLPRVFYGVARVNELEKRYDPNSYQFRFINSYQLNDGNSQHITSFFVNDSAFKKFNEKKGYEIRRTIQEFATGIDKGKHFLVFFLSDGAPAVKHIPKITCINLNFDNLGYLYIRPFKTKEDVTVAKCIFNIKDALAKQIEGDIKAKA